MIIDEKITQYLLDKNVDNIDNCYCYLFASINKLNCDLNISDNDKHITNTLLEVDIGITNIAGVKVKKFITPIGEESLDELVQTIRKKFEGLKPYSMGDKHDLKRKLARFFKEYPEYTVRDVLDATEHYLEHTNPTFVRRANYFIYKNIGKSERSDLLNCLSELKEQGKVSKTMFMN
jgi:hypothetical protein